MTTILLVDDSAVDRRLFGGLLEKQAGFEIEYAKDGAEALKHVQSQAPDLILTDMQMPEMDGLQLVNAIQKRFPRIPIVLMTGKGSEALATRALRQGAAGYVPKSQASQMLLDTINHVVDIARADISFEQIVKGTTSTEFKFVLENDPKLFRPLVALAKTAVSGTGICSVSECLQVGVALEQALMNALYHGNLELAAEPQAPGESGIITAVPDEQTAKHRMRVSPYRDRRITVLMRMNRQECQFTVGDEGSGFNVQEHTGVGLSTSSGHQSGRGLFLMWAFMDRVAFNRAGNQVTLTKRRKEAAKQHKKTRSRDAAEASKAEPAAQTTVEENLGQLVPREGGPPIRLTKRRMIVGRAESADIVLRHSDISQHHCLLHVYSGWWFVKDLDSRNGIKLNGHPVQQHRVNPGETLTFGKHNFKIDYAPYDLGAEGLTPPVDPF